MKTTRRCLFVLVLLLLSILLLAGSARAQVPNLINYQGRISVGTANFTGTGQFRFALTNSTGSTYYWTSDGSVVSAPQQPANAVSIPVTNGQYSVLLGDTSLANMTAIPTSVWANPDVRLRVFFSDGTNSSQALSPDQRLAPTGYLASGLTLAGTSTLTGDLNLPATTSASTGVLQIGGSPFLHAYGANGLSSENTFAGSNAGNFTLSGTLNTGTGYQALSADTTGSGNTASGTTALKSNTAGNGNTAAGYQALFSNTGGSNNSALGNVALYGNTTAGENVALGTGALQLQSFANGGTAWNSLNVAVGYNALLSNQPTTATNGVNNVALGANALSGNTTGANNIALGNNAGLNLTTGSNNIDIGSAGVAGETGIIRLGDGSTQTATYLTGIVNTSGLVTTVSADKDTIGTTSVETSLGLRLMNSLNSGGVSAPNVTGIGFGYNSTRQAIVGETYGNDGLDFYVSGNLTTPVVRINANGIISGNGSGLVGLTSSSLAAGSVTNTQLAANSVTATNIANGAVGSSQLASNLTLGGTFTLGGDLNLPATTSASTGVLDIGGVRFLHAYGANGLSDANTFVGDGAGNFTLTGTKNTATGYGALASDGIGNSNTANGYNALNSNTAGGGNVAVGYQALSSNLTGSTNVAVGLNAMYHNTSGGHNCAQGYAALLSSTGDDNTADGYQAGNALSSGSRNTAVGSNALDFLSTGSNNIAIGYNSAANILNGSNNIEIGNGGGGTSESNIIRIGDGSTQTDTYLTGTVHVTTAIISNAPGTGSDALAAGSTTAGISLFGRTGIGSTDAANVALDVKRFGPSESAASFIAESGVIFLQIGRPDSIALYVNRAAGLIQRSDNSSTWDSPSDERIKHDIKPVAGALATLERLRPVRFHYNADFLAKSGGTPDYERFGVVAQEFEKVFPDFVDTNADGMLSVRLDPIPIVTAAAVQELDAQDKVRDATVANLQAENVALKKQVAQMQADDKDRDARLARLEKLLPTK